MATAFNANPGTDYNLNGGAALTVQISNINFVQSLVQDDLKEQQLMEIVKSNPVVISYNTHNHLQTTLNSGSLTQTVNITEFQESVLCVHSVFRDSANLTGIHATAFDSTLFLNPNLSMTQTQVQPDYYPLQALQNLSISTGIPSSSELFYQYASTNEKQKRYDIGFVPAQWQKASVTAIPVAAPAFNAGLNANGVLTNDTDDFILATNFQVFPSDAVGPSEYIQYSSGLNLKRSPNPIAVNVVMNYANQTIMDSYTTFIKSLVIQDNNIFVVS